MPGGDDQAGKRGRFGGNGRERQLSVIPMGNNLRLVCSPAQVPRNFYLQHKTRRRRLYARETGADIVTPNQFELGFLTQREVRTLDETLAAVDATMAMGPRTVLVTSVECTGREAGTIEMLAADASGAWIVTTPHLPFKANGSGDVTAALFTAHYLSTGSAADALAITTASVFELLERTHESGQRELQLVQAQEAYVNPQRRFAVRVLR